MQFGKRERKPSPEKKGAQEKKCRRKTKKKQEQENAEKKSIWKLLIDKID